MKAARIDMYYIDLVIINYTSHWSYFFLFFLRGRPPFCEFPTGNQSLYHALYFHISIDHKSWP